MLAVLLVAAMFLVWARDDLTTGVAVLTTASAAALLAWMEATWWAKGGKDEA